MSATSNISPVAPNPLQPPVSPARTVAVVEIGSATVRLAVAQIGADGGVKLIDNLAQAVAVGRDTFTRGEIRRDTVEEVVRVLTSYRRVLAENQAGGEDQVRTVATAAVREATNRDAFIDRVYIGTGLSVEPLDESEITRLTYLGLYSQLSADRGLSDGETVVAAMEGGSTDIFYLHGGRVSFARTYRLGSVRLQKMLETFRAPARHERELMEDHVRQLVDVIRRSLPVRRSVHVLAVGGEARFAASQLAEGWDGESIVSIPVSEFSKLVTSVLEMTPDAIAAEYDLPLTEAETITPALFFHLRLARALHAKHIRVSGRSMRNGVLMEMARRGLWVSAFGDQIIEPAREIARKFQVNEKHTEHVAALARTLFSALKPQHKLGPWHELLLNVAALLHDIGLFVNERSHHKHSMYLIMNSDLFGLSPHDRLLVALVARYHRRAGPKPVHEGYATLTKEDRVVIAKLSAILRIADALDSSYSQRVRDIRCTVEQGRLVIEVPEVADLSLETLALRGKGTVFHDVYGLDVVLRVGAGEHA